MKILRDTNPAAGAAHHGGQHRTAQIDELVRAAGLDVDYLPREQPLGNLRKYLAGIRFLVQSGLLIKGWLRPVRRWGASYLRYQQGLRSHDGCRLLLWEDTHLNNCVAPYLARQAGFTVVALPQNLESLVKPFQSSHPGALARRLGGEVEHLARVHRLFCICREEQWLLALQGLPADFLPYYPASPLVAALLAIRQRRRECQPARVLILGTAGNRPTREGILAQIAAFQRIATGPDWAVDIAGYGTECLQRQIQDSRLRLHGSLEPAQLNALLINAKALWAHQPSGAGALTRIPEMLVAGIPVIANAIAARSALHYSGVYGYETESELAELLRQDLVPPPLPPRPVQAERRFQEYLLARVQKG